jgi:beta-aspartyl-peptidase (threonine type)
MQYGDLPLQEAARSVIQEKLKDGGGRGGVICVDKQGNIAMEFNTTGMLRAYVTANGEKVVKVFE